jgi:hypothetical protein
MKKKNTESSSEKSDSFKYDDHKVPMTRRDFLAAGAIGMTTLAFTSGLTTLLSSSNAMGAALACSGENLLCGNIPFLCLDGAGGMNIAGGNAIVGFAKNELQEDFDKNVLSDFRRLGIPDQYHPSKTGMINTSYGLKFHTTSGILAGLEEVLAPRTGDLTDLREHVDGLLLCGITDDDTNGNPLNTTYMAQKAGAVGDLVQLVGNQNTTSGGNSKAPADHVNLTIKPSQLTRFRDSESLLSIGDSLVSSKFLDASSQGGGARMKSFMDLIARAGRGRLNELKANRQVASDIERYHQRQNRTLNVFDTFSPRELNPEKNTSDKAILEQAFGQELTALSATDQTAGNIFNLLTKRTAGAATITIGGCDYHNGTAMTGFNKDKQIGRHIGQAIRMAALRGTPIFIHLYTDGGVTGDAAGQVDPALPTRVVWRSDSGTRSAALMIVFHPKKKRSVVSSNTEYSNFLISKKTRQIGYYKAAGGSAPDAHSLSNNVSNLWMAVILNYMATLVNSTDDEKIIYEVGESFKKKFGTLPPDWQQLIRLRSLVA